MAHVNTYIEGDRRYQVTSAAVIALRLNGPEVYLYHGALMPLDTLHTQIETLLAAGMIRPLQEIR